MKERIEFFDVAKGIAIWLMIVGHQHISRQTSIYIFSFHMPLFFFISGMFFRKDKPFFQNLESAIRGLLIPYLFFSIINLTICWITPYAHPELYYNMTGINIFRSAFNGIFIGTTDITPTSFLPLNELWFLMALFVTKIFCSALSSIIKNEYLWAIMSITISITLFFILTTHVYSMKSGMMATPFYVSGFLMRKIDFTQIRQKFIIILFLLLYFIFIIPQNDLCDLNFCHYGNWMIIYYFNGIVGTLMVLIISTYITYKNGILQKVGRNTLVILGMHSLFIRPIQIVLVYLFGYNCTYSLFYISIVPIVAIICCISINRYIVKYIPFAVGR